MIVSLQLFSSREQSDHGAVLRLLAQIGYDAVEGWAGAFGDDPAGYRGKLDQVGLKMPSVHIGLDELENAFEDSMATAHSLGVSSVYAPFLLPEDRPVDLAGWRALAGRLAALNDEVRAAGFGFGWHNHDFEFVDLGGGMTPMQLLLDEAPGMDWEADLAWIVRGGHDPSDWIKRYGSRITSVHVKDLAPSGQCLDEDGWADAGHGTLPWGELMAQVLAETPTQLLITEHDKPNDFARFANRAFDFVQSATGAARA